MATISIAPTPLFSTPLRKASKFGNGDPGPQMPSRTMYAMCFGSEAPVAEAYTILALGSLCCSSSTVNPVFVGFPAPVGHRFLARWHSSNTMTPSKSSPHQCSSCFRRVLYFPPPWDSPIRAE